MAYASEGKLFTGSKDSTVKRQVAKPSVRYNGLLRPSASLLITSVHAVLRWNVSGEHTQSEASFEGHSDWVNSIAILEDILVSCSSDSTVQFWRAEDAGGSPSLALLHARKSICRWPVIAKLQQQQLIRQVHSYCERKTDKESRRSQAITAGEPLARAQPGLV